MIFEEAMKLGFKNPFKTLYSKKLDLEFFYDNVLTTYHFPLWDSKKNIERILIEHCSVTK